MTNSTTADHYDAIVVGAGFAGLYALRQCRDVLGLRTRVFEKGSGIGGTWFWNRYPGAMSDTESPYYRFSFDPELLADDTWRRRYIDQPDILAYLERAVGKLDLARDIQCNAHVIGMHWDESKQQWKVTTTIKGVTTVSTARYVITALGLLSSVNTPNIAGIDSFKGRLVHTAEWPSDLSVDGKRVGVIGTGSTGTQFIVAAARTASKLSVFQRSPQYCVPSGNGDVDETEVASFKPRFGDVFKQVRGSGVGFGFTESTIPTMSVSPEEREAIFEAAWARGNGFYFMYGTFNDIAVSDEANAAAAGFIRKKIAEVVKDPVVAKRLTPTELYAKRPLCNHKYFEVYNQDNVELVSLKETPIDQIVPEGIRTADGRVHELDLIVLATGFDAVDGNYRRMDIRGRNGQTINEHWDDGPTSYLGMATSGFPNMFMIMGPNGPFSNIVPAIEMEVEFVTRLIADNLKVSPPKPVVVRREVEDAWTQKCADIANQTLFSKMESWIFGANVTGKKHTVLFYLGGLGPFGDILAEEEQNGFAAFKSPKAVKGSEAESAVTRVEEVPVAV